MNGILGSTARNFSDTSGFLHTRIEPHEKADLFLHFLFPVPMVSSSKLRRGSSRPPLVAAARVKDDDFDSKPGWTLWVVDRRPLPETNRLGRFSLASPDELGRLPEMTTLFEVLPLLAAPRLLSESAC